MEATMATQIQQIVQQMAGMQPNAGNGVQGVNGIQGAINGAQQAAGNSMFAALLQQMLGGNGESALLGAGPQQKAMLLEQMRKQLGQDGAELGMQLLAEMIAVNPAIVQQVDANGLAELVGQTAQPEGGAQNAAQSMVQTILGAQTQSQNLAAAQELQQAVTSGDTQQNMFAAVLGAKEIIPGQSTAEPMLNAQEKQNGTAADLNVLRQAVSQTVQVTSDTAQGSEAGKDGLTGQAQFQRALFEAQNKIVRTTEEAAAEPTESKTKKETEPVADNVLRFPEQTRLEQLGQAKGLSDLDSVDAKDLLQQVKTGLADGMKSGKNEFVIKLKPEGLGEITVRMLEEAGKITMSITTANAQTQKLLNNELAVLRDAVRPYNVEVQHVESQNTQSFDLQQQRQSFAQQQQQQQQGRHQSQSNYSGYDFAQEQPDAVAETLQYVASGLNTVV